MCPSNRRRSPARRPTRGRRPPRRGSIAPGLLIAALVLAGAGGVAVSQGLFDSPPATASSAPLSWTVTNGAAVAGVIVDPSGSNGGPGAARASLRLVAGIVQHWAGARPAPYQATFGTPGLDLTIRQISTNSYSPAAELVHIVVPAVPGLRPRPTDASNTLAMTGWADSARQILATWNTANQSAVLAGRRINAATLQSTNSEIAGAVSSMAAVLPKGAPRTVVIISDLLQDGAPPQVSGNLSGTTVIAFQTCNIGANACIQAAHNLRALTTRLHAARMVTARVETVSADLAAALHGQTP
jgi:hypothetical protein